LAWYVEIAWNRDAPLSGSVRKRPAAGVLDLCPQFFSNSKVELASNDNGNLFAIGKPAAE
jgi:hypothetical protein